MMNMQKDKVEKTVKYPPFSVAMSVYKNDKAEWFDVALNSVVKQTVKPNEIVMVVDGPICDELKSVIEKYDCICKNNNIKMNTIYLKTNQGHGNASKIALENSSNEIVARMDSDDISTPNRFEQQIKIMSENPNIDIVGGDISEFIGADNNIVAKRIVPVSDIEIKKYLKIRCPLNHVSVMYRKKAVLDAGNYQDLFCNEDYWLWIRMVEKGCKMMNTGTTLVNVRVGKDMYKRRGGVNYFKSELFLQKYMLKHKMISLPIFISNTLKRLIVQVFLPNHIRAWVFKAFARSK